MLCNLVLALSALVAVSAAACVPDNHPKVKAWIDASTSAKTRLKLSAEALTRAEVSASVYASATAKAGSTAGSLSSLTITKQRCVATEAASAGEAWARAAAHAMADAQALAEAHAAAESYVWASASAYADVQGVLCNCGKPSIVVSGIAVSFQEIKAESQAQSSRFVSVNAGIASASARAASYTQSYSEISAKVCNVCSPGYQKVTIDQTASNTQSAKSGNIVCTGQLKNFGLC
jgi:hypothetical protein